MGKLSFKNVGANLAAEVTGIDLSKPMDAATHDALLAGLAEHQLLIFRNQDVAAEELIAFGESIGDLSIHPFAPSTEDAPVLIRFENTKENPPFGTDMWHSDETFRSDPPMATVLSAKDVPEVGGDTMYASMSAAYEGLSERIKQLISGLEAIHDMKPFRSLFDDNEEGWKRRLHFEMLYPPVTHPVVRVHPVTGRKVLFVNPQFTIAIKDMDERESAALLDVLFHQALIPEFQYRLHWEPGTIAMWDNRSVQHYAIHDYWPQTRIMERVTIKGDRPVGVEAADPDTVKRAKQLIKGSVDAGAHRPIEIEGDRR